jgi:hypothetical protein
MTNPLNKIFSFLDPNGITESMYLSGNLYSVCSIVLTFRKRGKYVMREHSQEGMKLSLIVSLKITNFL